METPDASTVLAMLRACTDYFNRLTAGGCAEDVALDRTWDAYCCAFAQTFTHCYDPRDRLFESKLRRMQEKG